MVNPQHPVSPFVGSAARGPMEFLIAVLILSSFLFLFLAASASPRDAFNIPNCMLVSLAQRQHQRYDSKLTVSSLYRYSDTA
jgi:hypothetical protein